MKTKTKKRSEHWELSKLSPHPKQQEFFGNLSDAEIDSLAEDMKRNGQTYPVEATSDGTIICGHQRILAAKQLGWEEIQVWVREDLEQQGGKAVDQRFLEDNFNRRQLSKLEQARVYRRLRELHRQGEDEEVSGDVRDFIAERFGVSGRTLDRWERMLDAPVEIQRAVEQGRLSMGQAGEIADLPASKQKGIAEQMRNGKEPKAVFAELKSANKPSPATVEARVNRVFKSIAKGLEELNELEEQGYGDEIESQLSDDDVGWLHQACIWIDRMLDLVEPEEEEEPAETVKLCEESTAQAD